MVAGTDGQDTRVNTFQIGHRTGDHKGPPHRILTPLYLSPRQGSPTIRRIGPQSSCIVGAGEDVDVGRGPWWLPVRTHHHIYSPYLKCIDHHYARSQPFLRLMRIGTNLSRPGGGTHVGMAPLPWDAINRVSTPPIRSYEVQFADTRASFRASGWTKCGVG